MATTPFDSGLYRDLFHDPEIGSLLSDSAEIRAMMLVEGALAKAQGALGIIPELSAAYLERSAREIQIDPGGLAQATGQNGVPVPGLVAAMRKAMEAPEHAQYLHWGATTQDIMDSGLALRLRQVLALYEARLAAVLGQLATLAETYAETPMAGRTWMQVATPTGFGAVVASWGLPLLSLRDQLSGVREGCLKLSLSGAAGTLSAMGADAAQLRQHMAQALKLRDPDSSWHSARDGIAGLSAWATQIATSLGKMGEDILLMSQSGLREITLSAAGRSSTMPQKQNPVAPSLLSALARATVSANTTVQGAAIHRQQRDAAAWMGEWIALGQVLMATGRALSVAETLSAQITADEDAMRANIDDGRGLIYAEALQFALSAKMPRPEAEAAVKALCHQIGTYGGSLRKTAIAKWHDPNLGALFTPEAQLGLAPADARAFAARARS
jgi:3-carboxy-cis,cis-muconate cycloisomerase